MADNAKVYITRSNLTGKWGMGVELQGIEILLPCDSLEHAIAVYNTYGNLTLTIEEFLVVKGQKKTKQ